MASKDDIQKRFIDLRSDIAAFKQSIETLLDTLSSLGTLHDGLEDAEGEVYPFAATDKLELMPAAEIMTPAQVVESSEIVKPTESSRCRSCNLSDDLTLRWRNSPNSRRCKSNKGARPLESNTNLASPSSRESKSSTALSLTKLHDRWEHLYLSNEAAIMEAEQSSYFTTRRIGVMRLSTNVDILRTASTVMHPYSVERIIWSLIGMCFVAIDIVLIPVSNAWEIQMRRGTFEHYLLSISIIYWSVDILFMFNTAFADKSGAMVSNRKLIVAHYMLRWFFLDLATVLIDCCMWLYVSTTLIKLDGVYVLRILRLARGLRLIKLTSVSYALERLFSKRGLQALTLVLALARTMTFILTLAHVLACVWYALGKAEEDNGRVGWLTLVPHAGGMADEYTRSLAWTLASITANSVDASISPQGYSERVFMLVVYILSLVVLGCGIAKITETMLEIERINSETTRAKRVLGSFLKANEVPVDLRLRVIGFVLHRMKQNSENSLDPSIQDLLSSSLSSELLVSQRLKYIVVYPLFEHFQSFHKNVIVNLCKAFDTRNFAEKEDVFTPGIWAEALIITRQGTFLYAEGEEALSSGGVSSSIQTLFDLEKRSCALHTKPSCFAEYGLYVRAMHQCYLRAQTLGDTLELSGHNFAHSLRDSPSCIALAYKYAQLYTQQLITMVCQGVVFLERPCTLSEEIMADVMSKNRLYTTACEKVSEMVHRELDVRWEWLGMVYEWSVTLEDVRERLDWLFPEFGLKGIYHYLGEDDECNRCKCSILSMIYLHFDAYDDFTSEQPSASRLTREQWAELQEIYRWAAVSKDQFRSILVLLAIRGLGKVEAIVRSVPVTMRDPAHTISNLMSNMPQFVPSTCDMDREWKDFITQVLFVNCTFNMSQFLQGENNPSEIAELRFLLGDMMNQRIFQSYVLVFLGVVCSLRGAQVFHSSLHMDRNNAAVVLLGIGCLQHFESEQPQWLYWTFIKCRAAQLDMPVLTVEDYVLARLACLIRAKPTDCTELSVTWGLLHDRDRDELTRHFLADGIVEHAVLFTFLPTYLINAKSNAHFGLPRALALLVELLESLRTSGLFDNLSEDSTNATRVSLQNLASLIMEVSTARHLDYLGGHISFMPQGEFLVATVSTKMYRKLREPPWQQSDAFEEKDIAYAVKRLERKTTCQERTLVRFMEAFRVGGQCQRQRAQKSAAFHEHEKVCHSSRSSHTKKCAFEPFNAETTAADGTQAEPFIVPGFFNHSTIIADGTQSGILGLPLSKSSAGVHEHASVPIKRKSGYVVTGEDVDIAVTGGLDTGLDDCTELTGVARPTPQMVPAGSRRSQ